MPLHAQGKIVRRLDRAASSVARGEPVSEEEEGAGIQYNLSLNKLNQRKQL